ncbi:MAG: carboxypeptidase regulatory-like domain-containing protein [Acidobacteria bacterium]|nr:carboxypeptidase regulatory-like domain-containing protein [Acidobacteriota bacterium]
MRKFIAIILAVVAAQVVSAQSAATPEPTTSYCGNIGRSDGAAITGALVSMRHLAKGHMHQSKSGPDGKYCVNGLAVGKYGLTVSYRGFRIAYDRQSVARLDHCCKYNADRGAGFVRRPDDKDRGHHCRACGCGDKSH